MPDFNAPSSFSKDANYNRVHFGSGSGAKLLEVELNEMQDIQNDARKRVVKTIYRDGFLGTPAVTFSGGMLRIANAIIAFEGDIIPISSLEIAVALGEKVYLRKWFEEVNLSSAIKKDGNEQETTVPNKIMDVRYGTETSRRIQTKFNLSLQNNIVGSSYLEVGTLTSEGFAIALSSTATVDDLITKVAKHLDGSTNAKHIEVSEVQPVGQEKGGIWFEVGESDMDVILPPGDGYGTLIMKNAVVSDEPPEDTNVIWLGQEHSR